MKILVSEASSAGSSRPSRSWAISVAFRLLPRALLLPLTIAFGQSCGTGNNPHGLTEPAPVTTGIRQDNGKEYPITDTMMGSELILIGKFGLASVKGGKRTFASIRVQEVLKGHLTDGTTVVVRFRITHFLWHRPRVGEEIWAFFLHEPYKIEGATQYRDLITDGLHFDFEGICLATPSIVTRLRQELADQESSESMNEGGRPGLENDGLDP